MPKKKKKRDKYTILAMDGGGIRGVIIAKILQHIEEETGIRIAKFFDLIVGTSAGGIIATGLSRADVGGPLPASDMVSLYSDFGSTIFPKSRYRSLMSWIKGAKYDHAPLEAKLKSILGEATLAKTQPEIIVTAYDIEQRKPYLFKSIKAAEHKDRNHKLYDVAISTGAAPTYFEPRLLNDGGTRRVLIDGGVYAVNPAMIGISRALSDGWKLQDIVLCSIGTGANDKAIGYDDARKWGLVGWIKPLISILFDGVADVTDYHINKLLPGIDDNEPQRYFRFDARLNGPSDDMDNATPENIEKLIDHAEMIIEDNQEQIDRLIKYLMADLD